MLSGVPEPLLDPNHPARRTHDTVFSAAKSFLRMISGYANRKWFNGTLDIPRNEDIIAWTTKFACALVAQNTAGRVVEFVSRYKYDSDEYTIYEVHDVVTVAEDTETTASEPAASNYAITVDSN
jgi:hypothetical protein